MDNVAERKEYVVYLYLDEFGIPFYVGKGLPNRPYSGTGRSCKTPPRHQIVILYSELDEQTALAYEKDLIHEYGRESVDLEDGLLKNITAGGQGTSGYVHTEEAKKKMSRPGPGHPKRIARDWCHPAHGLVRDKSCRDLVRLFPSMDLIASALSDVALGHISNHRGWIFIDKSQFEEGLSDSQLMEKFSPEYAKNKLKEFEKRSEDNRLKSLRENSILRNWFHIVHGLEVGISSTKLAEKYKEENLNLSSLSSLSLGSGVNEHKGWVYVDMDEFDNKLSKSELERILRGQYIAGEICGRRVNQIGSKRTWRHPEHGTVENVTISELVRMFPDQKLSGPRLSTLAKGKGKFHRGWEVLPLIVNGEVIRGAKVVDKKSWANYKPRNWCHIEHGFVPNKSCAELVKEYSSENLGITRINMIANKKGDYHKGWIHIDNSEIDSSLTEEELKKKFSPEYAQSVVDKAKERYRKTSSRKGKDRPNYKQRSWSHIGLGFVPNKSSAEIIAEYPEYHMNHGAMSRVVSGEYSHHKGWVFIPEEEIDWNLSEGELKEKFSAEYAKQEIIRRNEKKKRERESTRSMG